MRQQVSIGFGYLAVVVIFVALWARMIFALRTGAPFVGYSSGSLVGTWVGLVVLVVGTLVALMVAVAHAAAAVRRWRSGS